MKQNAIFEQSVTITTNTTTNGTSNPVPRAGIFADVVTAILQLTRTGGTSPTMDVKFQVSMDGVTWFDISNGNFTQQTGTTATPNLLILTQLNFPGAKFVRWVAVTAGTAPATWAITVTIELYSKN